MGPWWHREGAGYATLITEVNLVLLVTAWLLLVWGWKVPSFAASLLLHATLFGWLAWAAFPFT